MTTNLNLKDQLKKTVKDSVKLANSSAKIASIATVSALSPIIGGAIIKSNYKKEVNKKDNSPLVRGFKQRAVSLGAILQIGATLATLPAIIGEVNDSVYLTSPENKVEIKTSVHSYNKTKLESEFPILYGFSIISTTLPLIDQALSDRTQHKNYGSLEIKTTTDIEGLGPGKKEVFCRYFLNDVESVEQIKKDLDLNDQELHGVWVDNTHVGWNKRMVNEPFKQYFENIENQGIEACIKDFESEIQGKKTYEVDLK